MAEPAGETVLTINDCIFEEIWVNNEIDADDFDVSFLTIDDDIFEYHEREHSGVPGAAGVSAGSRPRVSCPMSLNDHEAAGGYDTPSGSYATPASFPQVRRAGGCISLRKEAECAARAKTPSRRAAAPSPSASSRGSSYTGAPACAGVRVCGPR